jgi:transaldolase
MVSDRLLEIKQSGQSIWIDNLSRDLIQSGELQNLLDNYGVCGVTSNPAIFEKAIIGNALYDRDIEAGIRASLPTIKIYESLIFQDVRDACDILYPVYQQTDKLDGYVSIEVPPTIAHDTQATVTEALRYFREIGRENVMVKIPGTPSGLPAVTEAIAQGVNVNITLLFSLESYLNSYQAYIQGLSKRASANHSLDRVASVASFFLSRIDSNVDAKIDGRLRTGVDDITTAAKLQLIRGKVAIANAKVAYQEFKKNVQSRTWQSLAARNAQVQRLLWASTSTKDPSYRDVMYVEGLIGKDTVNTLPTATITACADHCQVTNTLETGIEDAYNLIESLKEPDININLNAVMAEVLREGIEKFVQPFQSLMNSLESKVRLMSTV